MKAKTILLTTSLLASLLLCPWTPAAAQGPPGALAELERQAEDRFAEDDLEGAAALYRQVAEGTETRGEKTRVQMIVAYLEHLQQHHVTAVTAVRDALVDDPGYSFRPELYDETFSDVFYEGQRHAADLRLRLAERAVKEGNERLAARDYGGARKHYQTALSYRPDHPAALYNQALAFLHGENEEEAETGFQKLLALGDGVEPQMRALALTNLGYLYERRRLYGEAEAFLEQAVELDPSKPQAWSILGVSRRQTGQLEGAAEAFRRAYELAPGDAQAMSHLALVYLDAGDFENAASLLEEATVADAGNANHWLQLGLARQGLGQTASAVTAFESAIRLDPDDARRQASNAATQLARHYYEAGNFAQSRAHADQALAWRPELVDARIYHGLAGESLGDLAGARESLEEALRLDPARAATHNNLGSVYYQLGLWDEAAAAFERALAIDADFPGAAANLEAVRQARSRPAAAPPPPPRRGAPPPRTARLGIRFADIDYAALGLKGAMVERVEAGSPAGRAGIQKNDLILEIDGRDVRGVKQLEKYVASRKIGSTVTLSLLRDNVPRRVDMRLD